MHELSAERQACRPPRPMPQNFSANRLERLGVALRVLSDPPGPWADYQGALEQVSSKLRGDMGSVHGSR